MNLTNEEIKTLVHKSLGWTERKQGPDHYAWSRGDYWHYLHEVPNYPESLDACAEFEKTIKAIHTYNDQLEIVVLGHHLQGRDAVAEFMLRCATPLQRCLAYLKTKGLIQ